MGRPRSFDEAAVTARAADLFLERGYEATSVDDLVAVTGLFADEGVVEGGASEPG